MPSDASGGCTPTPIIYDEHGGCYDHAPLNGFQKALHAAAATLPVPGGDNILDVIDNHVESIVSGIMPEVPDHRTAAEAIPFIREQLQSCLDKV